MSTSNHSARLLRSLERLYPSESQTVGVIQKRYSALGGRVFNRNKWSVFGGHRAWVLHVRFAYSIRHQLALKRKKLIDAGFKVFTPRWRRVLFRKASHIDKVGEGGLSNVGLFILNPARTSGYVPFKPFFGEKRETFSKEMIATSDRTIIEDDIEYGEITTVIPGRPGITAKVYEELKIKSRERQDNIAIGKYYRAKSLPNSDEKSLSAILRKGRSPPENIIANEITALKPRAPDHDAVIEWYRGPRTDMLLAARVAIEVCLLKALPLKERVTIFNNLWTDRHTIVEIPPLREVFFGPIMFCSPQPTLDERHYLMACAEGDVRVRFGKATLTVRPERKKVIDRDPDDVVYTVSKPVPLKVLQGLEKIEADFKAEFGWRRPDLEVEQAWFAQRGTTYRDVKNAGYLQ